MSCDIGIVSTLNEKLFTSNIELIDRRETLHEYDVCKQRSFLNQVSLAEASKELTLIDKRYKCEVCGKRFY